MTGSHGFIRLDILSPRGRVYGDIDIGRFGSKGDGWRNLSEGLCWTKRDEEGAFGRKLNEGKTVNGVAFSSTVSSRVGYRNGESDCL